ncbi:MAG: hypothetical protein ACOX9B_05650 [Candidatus Xenobium sp.]
MCSEERSVVGNYVSTAEVRLTTQTGPPRRPNATPGGGFRWVPGKNQGARCLTCRASGQRPGSYSGAGGSEKGEGPEAAQDGTQQEEEPDGLTGHL